MPCMSSSSTASAWWSICASVNSSRSLSRFPDMENPVLDQPHVAARRLQQREFVGERTFELGLADVHRATLALAVVVGVVPIAPFRPAAGERATAHIAAHESPQWTVWMIPRTRTGHHDATVEYCLGAIERGVVDK